MRGDVVHRVYRLHEGREEEYYFGTFRSCSEADAEIAKLCAREMNGRNWAKQYHNKGFVVRDTVVTVDFEIPPQPKPRDKVRHKGSAEAKSARDVGVDRRRSFSPKQFFGRP